LSTPTFLSRGDGSWDISNPALAFGGTNVSANWINAGGVSIVTGDFNGDGKSDFILQCQTCNWLSTPTFLSRGDGSWDISNPALAFGGTNVSANWINDRGVSIFTGDFNGDGKSDFILQCQTCNWLSTPTFLSNGTQLGQVFSISSTLGGDVENIRYGSLPQLLGGRYFADKPQILPKLLITPAVQVVSMVNRHDGLSGVRSSQYSYGNLLAEVGTGRGSLGFEWTQVKDESTGLVSRTYYRQDFPYIGQVDKVGRGTSEASWSNLGLTTYKYTFSAFAATDADYASPVTCVDDATTGRPLKSCTDSAIKPGNRYVPYTHEVLDKNWDWNDQTNVFIALPQTRTKTTQDNWGNATQIKVETLTPEGGLTGYSKTTSTVFAEPDKTNWRIGRVIKSTVTSAAP